MVLGSKDNISLLGPLSLLHHRLLRLQVLHLDCRLLGCNYHNINIPQRIRWEYKEKEPGSSSRGRTGWLDIRRAKLEAQPSSQKYAQPGGKGENREQHSASQV